MKRRGFLGFLGGAFAAGPSAAKAAIDTTLADAGFATPGVNAVMSDPEASPARISTLGAKIVKWIRKEGVPAWKMREIEQRARHQRSYGLDPDLACLRSVSPGYKAREQGRRNLKREVEMSLLGLDADLQREEFHDRMKRKFGTTIGWYQ